jgi:hypothetical protein
MEKEIDNEIEQLILPAFGEYEDVEFSAEKADVDDLEALERAEEADARVKRGAGE